MVNLHSNGVWFMNGHIDFVVSQADNADGFSVLRHTTPFDEAPPWHVHHDEDEIFQILSGRLRFKRADQGFEAGVGTTIFLPRGIPHGFRVISPEGAQFLTITRGRFEAMVRAGSRPATHPGLPEPTPMTPDLAAHLAGICAAHRVDLIGPPID